MAQYTESTLRNRAEKLGYKVEKGYQKLAGNEYGFLTDGSGNKITGYDLLKTVGSCEIPVDGIFESGDVTHSLSLDELEEKLKGLSIFSQKTSSDIVGRGCSKVTMKSTPKHRTLVLKTLYTM